MKQLRARYGCPVELALEFVGGKWKTVILAHLKESPLRYRDLRQRLPTVSDKVLTERVKSYCCWKNADGMRWVMPPVRSVAGTQPAVRFSVPRSV